MNDLSVMYTAFKKIVKRKKKFFVVYWDWVISPYLTGKNAYWLIDILPCIGELQHNNKNIIVTSVMGNARIFANNKCKVFSNRKDAVNFREKKRKELYSDKNLFNIN